MAASVTFTERTHTSVKRAKIVVVSAADGSASGTSSAIYDGAVLRFVAVPDAAATQPTNLFDVTITDADGYDVLAGQGANLSNAAPTTVVASMGAVAGDKLTCNVTNAGDTKGVTFYLYIR